MKIITASYVHETNTFCKGMTPYESFRVNRRSQADGPDAKSREVRHEGMRAAIEATGAELVQVFDAFCMPSGTIAAAAQQRLEDELIAEVQRELPADGILLMLHGAAVAEGIDDSEGHLVKRLRDAVGYDLPIVAYFDLHGNATQEMCDELDATLPCHEYPHVDLPDRAAEGIRLLGRLARKEIRPVTHVEHLPMLLQPSDTFEGFMKEVNARAAEIERRPGVIECGVFHGFPYCDIPLVGVHVISTTDGDLAEARANGRELAAFIWQNRARLVRRSLSPEEAFAEALTVDGGPVVVNDAADNPGGGSPGDATHVLRALLATKTEDACFAYVADPEVVEQAVSAGPGSTIRVRLGGKTDDLHGAPIEAEAYVKLVTDGVFTPQSGLAGSMGRTARLLIGGVDVLVSTLPNQVFHPAVFRMHGIEPERYRLVVLKGSNHFRAGFQEMAKAIVTADSPGLTTLRIEIFERSRTPRPIWPLDDEADYQPGFPLTAAASGR